MPPLDGPGCGIHCGRVGRLGCAGVAAGDCSFADDAEPAGESTPDTRLRAPRRDDVDDATDDGAFGAVRIGLRSGRPGPSASDCLTLLARDDVDARLEVEVDDADDDAGRRGANAGPADAGAGGGIIIVMSYAPICIIAGSTIIGPCIDTTGIGTAPIHICGCAGANDGGVAEGAKLGALGRSGADRERKMRSRASAYAASRSSSVGGLRLSPDDDAPVDPASDPVWLSASDDADARVMIRNDGVEPGAVSTLLGEGRSARRVGGGPEASVLSRTMTPVGTEPASGRARDQLRRQPAREGADARVGEPMQEQALVRVERSGVGQSGRSDGQPRGAVA